MEELTVRGAVVGDTEESGGSRLELEVWVENPPEEKTALGWGDALVAA